ncbi:MAG: hypothetical protein ABI556_09040 [Gemmatimonadales bacterium]
MTKLRELIHRVTRLLIAIVSMAAAVIPRVSESQVLETETARFLPRGSLEAAFFYELQTAVDGREHAVPFAFEYALLNRVMVLIEPVPYTAIRPRVGRGAAGPGDMEVTSSFLVAAETRRRPAFAIAAEVKLPTARDTLIGTRKVDLAGYVIASKRLGKFDTHANIGYTIVGKPAGVSVSNIFYGAAATEYHASRRVLLFGEVLAQTAAVADGESADASGPSTTPELGSAEVVGTAGIGWSLSRRALAAFSMSRDNSGATLFRTGVVLRWLPQIGSH